MIYSYPRQAVTGYRLSDVSHQLSEKKINYGVAPLIAAF